MDLPARQLRALTATDLEPVVDVVTDVVAGEGQHGEGVESHLADRPRPGARRT